MNLQDIRSLYEFNYWAKARILDSLTSLTPEQYALDLKSSHGGIQGTLVHLVGAEEIWVRRWKGESPATFMKPADYPTLQSISDRWDMVEHEIMGFCHMLKSDADIAKTVTYKDLKGNTYTMALAPLMQHLVNHSSYHRGQIVTMLRQSGIKPPATDLVAFYREQAAKPAF
jgi:uncharacterized damage-inducible protein DinB